MEKEINILASAVETYEEVNRMLGGGGEIDIEEMKTLEMDDILASALEVYEETKQMLEDGIEEEEGEEDDEVRVAKKKEAEDLGEYEVLMMAAAEEGQERIGTVKEGQGRRVVPE